MFDKLIEISNEFELELKNVTESKELDELRVKYLGKKGLVTSLFKDMGKLAADEKKSFGEKINITKSEITEKIAGRLSMLKQEEIQKKMDEIRYVLFQLVLSLYLWLRS